MPRSRLAQEYEEQARRIRMTGFFKRLAGKTQLYGVEEGFHERMRMTHTLDIVDFAQRLIVDISEKGMAQADERLREGIGPEIASRLPKSRPDLPAQIWLATAIALGHDLGHTPFGHAGEQGLSEAMREAGLPGYEHNWQSVRIAEWIEEDATSCAHVLRAERSGMGLSLEVLDGILNHTRRPKDGRRVEVGLHFRREEMRQHCHTCTGLPCTAAGLIVAIADEVCQRVSDVEDGLRKGVIEARQVEEAFTKVRLRVPPPLTQWPSGDAFTDEPPGHLRNLKYHARERLSLHLLHRYAEETQGAWRPHEDGWGKAAEQCRTPGGEYKKAFRGLVFTPKFGVLDGQLENLVRALHREPSVAAANAVGARIVTALFRFYMQHPGAMVDWYGERFATVRRCCKDDPVDSPCEPRCGHGCRRDPRCHGCEAPYMIADYVAAMTDDRARKHHRELVLGLGPLD